MKGIKCTTCGGINTQSILAEDRLPYSVVGYYCHDCHDGFTPKEDDK